jgi:formate hydrogenlyase subunit 3/multisubunit Na+/H+ antiporter MnhD subunit
MGNFSEIPVLKVFFSPFIILFDLIQFVSVGVLFILVSVVVHSKCYITRYMENINNKFFQQLSAKERRNHRIMVRSQPWKISSFLSFSRLLVRFNFCYFRVFHMK